jgi:hypothetical protein
MNLFPSFYELTVFTFSKPNIEFKLSSFLQNSPEPDVFTANLTHLPIQQTLRNHLSILSSTLLSIHSYYHQTETAYILWRRRSSRPSLIFQDGGNERRKVEGTGEEV